MRLSIMNKNNSLMPERREQFKFNSTNIINSVKSDNKFSEIKL